jgi:hypothetical protein
MVLGVLNTAGQMAGGTAASIPSSNVKQRAGATAAFAPKIHSQPTVMRDDRRSGAISASVKYRGPGRYFRYSGTVCCAGKQRPPATSTAIKEKPQSSPDLSTPMPEFGFPGLEPGYGRDQIQWRSLSIPLEWTCNAPLSAR